MSNGWIKVHRKVLNNPIVCKDAEHFAVWMFLLLNASHAEIPFMFNGEKIKLQPGQLVTCLQTISKTLHISKSKTKRVLDLFKSETQIETQPTRHGTLVTVINWLSYQESETQNGTLLEHQLGKSGTLLECNKNVRSKEVKNSNIPQMLAGYTSNEELQNTLTEFIAMRQKIKSPLTDYALQLVLKKINKLSGGSDKLKILLLNQSIENSWKGIFPLKGDENNVRVSKPSVQHFAGQITSNSDYDLGFYATDQTNFSKP